MTDTADSLQLPPKFWSAACSSEHLILVPKEYHDHVQWCNKLLLNIMSVFLYSCLTYQHAIHIFSVLCYTVICGLSASMYFSTLSHKWQDLGRWMGERERERK